MLSLKKVIETSRFSTTGLHSCNVSITIAAGMASHEHEGPVGRRSLLAETCFDASATLNNGRRELSPGALRYVLRKLCTSYDASIVDGLIDDIVSKQVEPVQIEKFMEFVVRVDTYMDWVCHMTHIRSEQRKVQLQLVFGLRNLENGKYHSAALPIRECELMVSDVYDETALSILRSLPVWPFLDNEGELGMDDLVLACSHLEVKQLATQRNVKAAFDQLCADLNFVFELTSDDWRKSISKSIKTLLLYYKKTRSEFKWGERAEGEGSSVESGSGKRD